MSVQDGAPHEFEEQVRAASEMLESSLLRAVSTVESELARVVRNGEADLERLARKIAGTVASDAAPGAGPRWSFDESGNGFTGSMNQIAAALARAARRGARFS